MCGSNSSFDSNQEIFSITDHSRGGSLIEYKMYIMRQKENSKNMGEWKYMRRLASSGSSRTFADKINVFKYNAQKEIYITIYSHHYESTKMIRLFRKKKKCGINNSNMSKTVTVYINLCWNRITGISVRSFIPKKSSGSEHIRG